MLAVAALAGGSLFATEPFTAPAEDASFPVAETLAGVETFVGADTLAGAEAPAGGEAPVAAAGAPLAGALFAGALFAGAEPGLTAGRCAFTSLNNCRRGSWLMLSLGGGSGATSTSVAQARKARFAKNSRRSVARALKLVCEIRPTVWHCRSRPPY